MLLTLHDYADFFFGSPLGHLPDFPLGRRCSFVRTTWWSREPTEKVLTLEAQPQIDDSAKVSGLSMNTHSLIESSILGST